jgi:putative DNA methylase
MPEPRLIESDAFPFEFLSQLAERESWRKEVHRPIYHVHKWWAKRLGSIFRGILLGSVLPESADLRQEFYSQQAYSKLTVFDPFMGSGTTIGEAHKLGFSALGRDINPVAVEAVRTALGPLDRKNLLAAVEVLRESVGEKICALYRAKDSRGRPCDVLYTFWVMQAKCSHCEAAVDLFPSCVIARNAYPDRKSQIQIRCPSCGDIFEGIYGCEQVDCPKCEHRFNPTTGPAKGGRCCCPCCRGDFKIVESMRHRCSPPAFRQFAKLILTAQGTKVYEPATQNDLLEFEGCSTLLHSEIQRGNILLPELRLKHGFNTRQAMNYGFLAWRQFFNDRQLLALGWLHSGIQKLKDTSARNALLTLFSGVLEFNNLFASYKGEGTGAVRHMFSHHILKPERMPIEAHVWGTPKSSGSFTSLFRTRLLRASEYQASPTEVNGKSGPSRVCAPSFSGKIEAEWPAKKPIAARGIYLSCGDSSSTQLPAASIDLIVTDPPFFDNVHYSELADFFYSWQQVDDASVASVGDSTRHPAEVQDSDSANFAAKLRSVFNECHRVLKDDGLLVFTYHHSRAEGWQALAEAVLNAGFLIVTSQPVKAEMSVATPKAQAKEPIQLDIVIVCRKLKDRCDRLRRDLDVAMEAAKSKLQRLWDHGFVLSQNDVKIVLFGQALASIIDVADLQRIALRVDAELTRISRNMSSRRRELDQQMLFEELR